MSDRKGWTYNPHTESWTYDPHAGMIPKHCLKAMNDFYDKQITGQILLNYNRGEIQSFELKEHHRVTERPR